MKIAYFLGSLNRGGTEVLVLDILRNIQSKDYSVILVHRKKGRLYSEFASLDVPLFHLFPKNKYDIKYFFRLRKLLNREKVDIIHAQHSFDALLAWVTCLFTNTKIIWTLHGFDFNLSTLSNIITKFIIKRTHANIYVSEVQMKYYKKKYSLQNDSKNLVVYNGISFEKFKNVKITSIKRGLNIQEQFNLYAFVGNFNAVRNQFLVCKFLKLLEEKVGDYKFLFIGKKDELEPWRYNRCEEFCKKNNLNNVMFLGSRNDVPNILSQIDAFVYASEHDTFGIAVVEAIAMGIPVFVNDWEVFSEITHNGDYATLYETDNEHDLLCKFMDFLSNSDHYKKNASDAAEIVKNIYSIESNISHLKKIYKN
jgi:L-malate glycosyltransferase